MKKRNSLIELYRFFFALNVVKNHGFFPEGFNYFSPGRVSVEFFFVLSGYLFARTLDRLKDLPLKEGLLKLVVGKLKPLFAPLIIGVVTNIIYNIIAKEYFDSVWGYLWYVEAMMLILIAYLILRRLIKSDKAFTYTVLGVFIVATLMRFSGIFYTWGYVRAAATVSLGMLLAKLPKIQLRRKWIVWIALVPIQAMCVIIVCFHLGNTDWWGGFRGVEFILDNLLYPALIYLTFNVSVNSRILNYLGGLSFGLYAFQCPADLMRLLGISNRYILLVTIVVLAIAEDLIKRIVRAKKNKLTMASSAIQGGKI